MEEYWGLFEDLVEESGEEEQAVQASQSPSVSASPPGSFLEPGVYRKGGEVRIKRDRELDYYRSLRVKRQKINAWWVEKGRFYLGRFRFVGLTLTFRDVEAYKDFEKWGGRRRFIREYKRICREQAGREVILDYVCTVEFQSRGVIHYHYLLVVPFGVRIPFPDRVVFRWGFSNLVSLSSGRVRSYLTNYIKKMEQLAYDLYVKWKAVVGHSFRLYEFSRVAKGVMSLLNVGWGRALYWRVLKGSGLDWRFEGRSRKLYLFLPGLLVGIKAVWDCLVIGGNLFLRFGGFRVSTSEQDSFVLGSLDELVRFVSELKDENNCQEV